MTTTQVNWTQIRKECRAEYDRLIAQGDDRHSSFSASDAIDTISDRHNLGYGSEGFCTGLGRHGITYLSMADTYDTTVIFYSDSERFCVGSVGDVIEANPNRYQ